MPRLPWIFMLLAFLRAVPSAHASIETDANIVMNIGGYYFSTPGNYLRGSYVPHVISPTQIRLDLTVTGAGTSIYYPYAYYSTGGMANPYDAIASEYDVTISPDAHPLYALATGIGASGNAFGYSNSAYAAFYKTLDGNGNIIFNNNGTTIQYSLLVNGTPNQTITITEAGYYFFYMPPNDFWPADNYQSDTISYTFGKLFPQVPNLGNGSHQTPRPSTLMADPVSATTGEFSQSHVDLHINGPLPIEVRRTYSSLNTSAANEFGYGWLSGYSSYLIPSSDGTTIQAADADGSTVVLRQQPGSATVWSPTLADNPALINDSGGAKNLFNSIITQTTAGSTVTYTWNLPDGSVRTYVVQSFPLTVSGVVVPQQQPYLSTWVDNRGNTLTFTYGANSGIGNYGKITQIQSSNGSSVSFSYDLSQHIIQAVASDGRTVNYTYNSSGDLTAVQLPDGNTFSYQCSNHLITQETKPDNSVVQNTYDSLGRVITQNATVAQNNPNPVLSASFDYSVPGQTAITDANGNSTVYQYDATSGAITRITDPLGQSINQTWYTATNSSNGAYQNSLQSVTDKRGLVTTYEYDLNGNITKTVITGNLTGGPGIETVTTSATYNNILNLPVTVTDASGVTTAFTYDTTYQYLPAQIVTSKGGTTLRTDLLSYTAKSDSNGFSKGLLGTKTVASGSPDQAVTSYLYNSAGLVTQQTVQTGTTDPNVVTKFTYTARGELGIVTDSDGRSTTYTYDGMSRPLTKVVKDENNNILGTWTTAYTGTGEVSTTTGPRTGPGANSVQFTYDGAGRLEDKIVTLSQAQTSNPAGIVASNYSATTSYGYDYFGNLVMEEDPNGNVTSMVYDTIGQLLYKDTSGLRTERFQYEPGGKISQYTNPLGGITNTSYTSTGQLCQQTNPDGSVLQWRYYTDGRLQQEILRNGSSWTTVYDDINRTVTRTLTNAAGAVLATDISVYDRRGNLVSHTDPEGYVKTTTYDGLNRVKTASGPASVAGSAQQTMTFIYGASAKALTTQNGLGESTVTVSDALGRPLQTQVLDSGSNVIRTTSYAYSSDNNAVTVTKGTSAGSVAQTTWTDTRNLPVLTVFADGTSTSNAYDLNGNLLFATDALGQTTSYAYNGLNQLTAQTLPDGTVTNFTYDAAGDLLTRTMADGSLVQGQTFDRAGRKLTEQLSSGTGSTRQYSYAYYPAGSPAVGLLQTVTAPRDTVTTTYDDFLRPQTVTTSGALPETNGSTVYGYDRRNLVTSISQSSVANAAGPATQVNRTYDGYGHMQTETVTAGGSTYANVTQTWDAAGRRASLNDASSNLPAPLFTYQHYADGLLAQVTANNQNYAFYYADNGLLTGRTNPFRIMSVNARDAAGRILEQNQVVSGASVLDEDMFWQANNTLSSYSATRGGTGAWNDTRAYSYNNRGQLLTEGFAAKPGAMSAFNYTFDGTGQSLGVRLDAKIGSGSPVSWETSATVDGFGRVTADSQLNASGSAVPSTAVPASVVASGADHVNIFVERCLTRAGQFPGKRDVVHQSEFDRRLAHAHCQCRRSERSVHRDCEQHFHRQRREFFCRSWPGH